MAEPCEHFQGLQTVAPLSSGCPRCMDLGDDWVHLRMCLVCGEVGCCDSSKNKHARKHFEETGHAVMRSIEPRESWGWCYVDRLLVKRVDAKLPPPNDPEHRVPLVEAQPAGSAILLDNGTLRFQRTLPGPIERLWAYLTEPDKRATWLAGGRMELRRGGEVELLFRHADLSDEKEPIPERYREMEGGDHMRGTIVECEVPRVLRFTWAENRERSSEVTFELEPQDDWVRLTVTHRRLVGRHELVSVASGWHTHLDILAERLAGTGPAPFWTRHLAHEREYERLIPGE